MYISQGYALCRRPPDCILGLLAAGLWGCWAALLLAARLWACMWLLFGCLGAPIWLHRGCIWLLFGCLGCLWLDMLQIAGWLGGPGLRAPSQMMV